MSEDKNEKYIYLKRKECQDLKKVARDLTKIKPNDRSKDTIGTQMCTYKILTYDLEKFVCNLLKQKNKPNYKEESQEVTTDTLCRLFDRGNFLGMINEEIGEVKEGDFLKNIDNVINQLKLIQSYLLVNNVTKNEIVQGLNLIYKQLIKSKSLKKLNPDLFFIMKREFKLWEKITTLVKTIRNLPENLNKKNIADINNLIEKVIKSFGMYYLLKDFSWDKCFYYSRDIAKDEVRNILRERKQIDEADGSVKAKPIRKVSLEELPGKGQNLVEQEQDEHSKMVSEIYETAFSSISLKCQKMIHLKDVEGWTHDQIKEEMGIESNTQSRDHLRRCKQDLKEAISKHPYVKELIKNKLSKNNDTQA